MTTADAGTTAWLRTQNDLTALGLLLEHGPLSRSRLGRLSGMSKPTAGQMVARLERLGLVAPVGEVAESRGPNAVVYGVRADGVTGVAVSVLADSLEAVVTDPLGTAHPVAVVPLTAAGGGASGRSPEGDVAAAVRAACEAAGTPEATVSEVAVGVQAAVDAAADDLSYTDTLPGWPQRGARERIERATGLVVTLENDVNLATAAERATPALAGVEQFVHLWLGEGLGVGIDVGGVVQRGASGGAGEIGYLEVPRSAAAVDPDAVDLTDLLGGPAVVRLLGGPEGEPLREALARWVRLAERDDDAHPRALAALADRIVLVVPLLVTLLDPGVLVVGGPTGVAGGAALVAAVQERLDAGSHPTSQAGARRDRLRVLPSSGGDQPVLRGAGQLLQAHLRARLEQRITAPDGAAPDSTNSTDSTTPRRTP